MGSELSPSWRERLRALKREAYALYLAMRDPRTPWLARIVAGLTVAHTFSPIDLIPDFIPVLGLLDDLIITPLGIWLSLKLIPPEVMTDARVAAKKAEGSAKPVSKLWVALVLGVWILLGFGIVYLIFR